MAFAKFEDNRFRIDPEIAENHAILVNLTASRLYNANQCRLSLGLCHGWILLAHCYGWILFLGPRPRSAGLELGYVSRYFFPGHKKLA